VQRNPLIKNKIRLPKLNLRSLGATAAMVDATPLLPGLSPVQGKAMVVRFDGGRLSSDGGLLVLRGRAPVGMADRLAA